MNKVKIALQLVRQDEVEYSFEVQDERDASWFSVQWTKNAGLTGTYDEDDIDVEAYLMYNTSSDTIRNIIIK